MATYRVGEAGATVFDTDGLEVGRLEPGQVVVEGTIDVRGSLAAQHADNERARKRLRGYPDKRRRVPEDKAR